MSAIKLWIVVVSCFAVGHCAGESRKIDEVQYKNHRTASVGNETSQNHAMLHKAYPVYPVQVYANLSNVRDFGASNQNTEQQHQSRTTEMPMDVVRVFFTSPPAGKRKPLQDVAYGTNPVPGSTTPATGSVYRTVTPSAYIVTARNVAVSADTKDPSHESPIYSVPRPEAEVKYATSTVDFRGAPTVTEEQSRFKTKFNGTKIRRVLKAQNQSSLHSTATTSAQIPPQFASNQRNSTAYTVNAKSNAPAVASSKPFATVLVPKHVLDGGVQHQHQQQQVLHDQEDSFRPIVPPIFTPYKSPNAASAVDTNSIVDNRRSSVVKNNQQSRHRATSVTAAPKLSNYGFVKPLTYKVEEYVPGDVKPSVVLDRGYSNEQDRPDRTSVISQKRDVENPHKSDNDQSTRVYYESAPRYDGPPKRGESLKYGLVEPAVGQFNSGSGPQQYREFYEATEWPAAAVKYEKFDARSKPQQFGSFRVPGPVSEPPPNEYFNGPPSSFSPVNPPSSVPSLSPSQTESEGPEFVMGDLNPKDVLKSLLRDMLKSKQQSELKQKTPPTMDDIIESYINTNQQKADDSFDIQTDMNCNLRSTKYITDGQCVSTKPVVEAVCADRCLVSASSLSPRHRSSPFDNAQVEALQCADGDVKMVRVQLKCRDGNMFNNVIKVVTNCRCKLHQTQPQMVQRERATINPDIMAIAAGQF